jgi:hypothetical protein
LYWESIRLKAKELGIDVPELQHAAVLQAVKRAAITSGRLISDAEFIALVRESVAADQSK